MVLQLTAVLRQAEGAFDLRQFHRAVRAMPSFLSENIKPDGFEFSKQGIDVWSSQSIYAPKLNLTRTPFN